MKKLELLKDGKAVPTNNYSFDVCPRHDFDMAGANGCAKCAKEAATLASPSMEASMQALRERIRNDPGYGVELLRRAGIVNERGELTERFGGEPEEDEYAAMELEHMGDPIKKTGIYAHKTTLMPEEGAALRRAVHKSVKFTDDAKEAK